MDRKRDGKGPAAALLAAAILLFTVTLVQPDVRDGPPARAAMATASAAAVPAARGAPRVVPLGRTVGIKLFSDGVLVVGLADGRPAGDGPSPARRMGLRAGDVIVSVNDCEVDTIEQMQAAIRTLGGEPMTLQVVRDEKQISLTGAAAETDEGDWRLGAWIRDSMAGIGTATFYDPATGRFAALGHGVNDVDTARLMTLESGAVMPSTVTGVKKGEPGAPGELRGAFDLGRDLGTLSANTGAGVFGTLDDPAALGAGGTAAVAARDEVKTGPAVILANVSGDEVKEYQAKIVHLYPAQAGRTRDLMLQVTDPGLLAATGGIVQGMSGSPILQDGKLVGAVTHVLVNDPTRGYGILAETMLAEMGDQ